MLRSIVLYQTAPSDFFKSGTAIINKDRKEVAYNINPASFSRLYRFCESQGFKAKEACDSETWLATYTFKRPIVLDVDADRRLALLTAAVYDEMIAKGLKVTSISREFAAQRMQETLVTVMADAAVDMSAQVKIVGLDYWMTR